MKNALPHNKTKQSVPNSLKLERSAAASQKDQIETVRHQILQLAAALNVTGVQILDAVVKHGHPGSDGTNLDKALGLPLGSSARAVLSITGCGK